MKEDKRKNNGGNSTKSNKALDKRRNNGKELIEEYLSKDFDYTKFKQLMDKLFSEGVKGDTKSAQLFLDHVVGKPLQRTDITTDGESMSILPIEWTK